jgi:methylmalonyl-CoA mutase N-terminal domain/subunit
LHCNGRDEALALPTEQSATLALRTQQIIAWESGVANTADPVGGSYEIEARTNEIEESARAVLKRIETAGGTLTAIESGMIQREIQESAFRAQRAIDSGEVPIVGVTRFQTDARTSIPTLRIDPEVERTQIERVRHLRASRDAVAWRAALDAAGVAARDGSNLVPLIIAAVTAKATVGEISDTLRSVFGEHREASIV